MESKELESGTNMNEQDKIETLPVLALKNSVLFPNLMMPLSVGRPASMAAVEAAAASEGKEIVLVAQRDPNEAKPDAAGVYSIGTKGVIRKLARVNESLLEVLVLGVERIVVVKLDDSGEYLRAKVRPLPLPDDSSREVEALSLNVVELATKMAGLTQAPQATQELTKLLATNEDPLRMVHLLATLFNFDLAKEQQLLEAPTTLEALRLMHGWLAHEVEVLELRSKIATEARQEMSKEQKEYVLRQQLRAIQQELGEKSPDQAEVESLKERLKEAKLPDDVRKEAEREMSRLERLSAGQPEFHVIRTYLEYVCDLPWSKYTEDSLDLGRARAILDEDHYGVKEVKERILEHLAVLKLNPDAKAPILCFVGPPGVGKTSLGQSIAKSLGRKFERMSVGGMHDEAELRGHRRTYIGAMPGRVIQAMRRAGAANPVIMLDEVDKMGRDFRGDPAAALLEILDPEQNKNFRDNYLDLPFDLSKVMFVCTANTLDTVPRPLLDRMEILRLAGYSEEEKMSIARKYLIPRQLANTGVKSEQVELPDETLRKLIASYTREAGVRRLEQTVGRVLRKIALQVAEGAAERFVVTPEQVSEMLGPEPFLPEQARRTVPAGVSTGLAWTETGGDVLYIEASLLPDGKGLTLTGQLGDVMKESAHIAQSYVWAHARQFGIDTEKFKGSGVHVHVPAGAIPKDGPSAGIAMTVALTSLYTGIPARNDTAMTGEVTLTGLALPIGGVKEKVLAARRAGIKRVVLPKANQKDLRDVPEEVRNEMTFVLVERVEEAIEELLPGIAAQVAKAA